MNLLRRKFVKTATFVGAAVTTLGSGVLLPQRAIGAYAEAAFSAKDVSGALTGTLGSDQHSASDQVKLKAPDIAENGAVVPITVSCGMDGIEGISIVAVGNPVPLTSSFMMTPACEGFVSTRIKMGKTSDVLAVVKAGGKLYSTSKEVKVTIGGCGG